MYLYHGCHSKNRELCTYITVHTTQNPGGCFGAQIREQMSGPDLNVFTLKFLALKKQVFHP